MVDFTKRLAKHAVEKPVAPNQVYERLDRASDKGPLRPAQVSVLEEWHAHRRADRDVIVKLHTGQGKTLVGLLMLQSRMNESEGRALYLCPNHFLTNQTLAEAKRFGIRCVGVDEDGDLPAEFLDGKAILVAPVQKLFNGRTKFGLGGLSTDVDYLVLDDAHACVDSIKDACVITLERTHPAYQRISELFAADLEAQGVGTYAEIRLHPSNAIGPLLPVPYWAWAEHHQDVAAILADHAGTKQVKFAWPLLRDRLHECLCVVAGRELVISPYLPPLDEFGSYANARNRIFMSATVTDDSFLIRGLGLDANTIKHPLSDTTERWSGEKMILLPALIDAKLDDATIVSMLAKPKAGRRFGIVVLVPSFDSSKDWQAEGAVVATKEDIDQQVEKLRAGERDHALVIANRYDGIDLPDASCRILVLDGKPYGETLLERYVEEVRPGSSVLAARTARIIEQGLGRAVRGEKDYCVVLLTGSDLVKSVRTKDGRRFLSSQARLQVELGIEISEMVREEMRDDADPEEALRKVMNQCLGRDEGWKEFYREKMDALPSTEPASTMLGTFETELRAERRHLDGDHDGAAALLQTLIDSGDVIAADKGWYLQEMARYLHARSKIESNKLQEAAHRSNRLLLKPAGLRVQKLVAVGQKRAERVIAWMRTFENYQEMSIALNAILTNLRFGVRAEPFERAVEELGSALGFASERPEKEWKAGPDNLWALRDGEYMLVECKSEVLLTRPEINKAETGQINNSSAWFAREYGGARVKRVLVIPTKTVALAAGFNQEVGIMQDHHLRKLTSNVRGFFNEFQAVNLRDVTEARVHELLTAHGLSVESLQSEYTTAPRYK